MSARVTIVDYGVGNLFSVRSALEYCGAESDVTDDPQAVAQADRLLLPGVGAFGDAMRDIQARRLAEPIRRFAATGRPLLGICLGMQLLMEESQEFGRNEGLALIPGLVRAVPATGVDGSAHRIPHVGWRELAPSHTTGWSGTILDDVAIGAWMYFVHSYTSVPTDPLHRIAECHYDGRALVAVVARDNVMGCQFHPEKSGEAGLAVVRTFLTL